tara:strand:+ start:18625 stop:20106 length:1482 start_codon:yes stop_codon:yes gene_type:complete
MALSINKLQVRQSRFDSSKMTDLNHWSKNLALKPTVFEAPQRALFSSKTDSLNLSNGNILEGIFGLGKTKYVDDLTWSWKMRVKGYRPMTILENRTAGATPGKYRQPIKVLVDVDLAAIGETWSPGSSDKSQVVVVTDKKKESRGFEYTLKTYTEGSEHFIKKAYLEPGVKYTRFYAMRGEAAESGGHSEMFTNVEYKNNLVKLRKEFKVSDFGAQAVLDIAFQDDQGKTHTSWMDMQEAEYHMKMNKELAINAMYSRLGDQPLIDPDSGYPINPGAGIEQQIGFGGNVERYTTMSAELIEAFFDKIVYSRISPGDLGEVIGYSGHYGMKEFAKALDVWTGGKSIVRNSEDFLAKDPNGVHANSLRTGYQFTQYALPNGGTFKLIHNPLNDDQEIHRDIDPLTGYPLQSQRITILDVTGGNGQSINKKDNICLVRKNKVYGTTIVEGRYGPGGEISKNPSHSGDHYRVDISDSVGVEIKDPTVTGELVKSVNV